MRKAAILLMAIILMLGSATAWANIPVLTLEIDGQSYVVPESAFQETSVGGYLISYFKWSDPLGYGEIEITNSTFNADPSVSIAFSAKLTSNGSHTFGVFSDTDTSGFPFPAGSPTVFEASANGGFTDKTGNGFTMTGFYNDGTSNKLMKVTVSDPAVILGYVGDDVTIPSSHPGAFTLYGPYSVGPEDGPLADAGWGTLKGEVKFTLTGDAGDAFGGTAFASLEPIPLPASILLLGSGLLGLAGFGFRKK